MIREMRKEKYLEIARQASRWYMRNQNTDENPWGGIRDSADQGRFIYEYFPAIRKGRGAGVWAQALGIMALDSVNMKTGVEFEYFSRRDSAVNAGRYLMSLQYNDRSRKENHGGFAEHIPGDEHSFPRDAATGGIGLCALYRITGDVKYLDAARTFADWYRSFGSDEDAWPYCNFSFAQGRGYNDKSELLLDAQGHTSFVKGDWQAGGALFYYYLSALTGERKYIDEYMLPVIQKLLKLYELNPVEKVVYGFHGKTPVSFGNDDFALVTLMAASLATGSREYLDIARHRILGLLNISDPETGRFPSYAGTFTMGITIKVLKDLEEHFGNRPDSRLQNTIELIAENSTGLQAYDYNEVRISGGFWGQSNFEISRDRIHHRSTGYAAIFYSMITDGPVAPYYHCLNWTVPGE